jgi:hypothetical protein
MNVASLVLSAASLIAVVLIGLRSISLGRDAADSAARSADASEKAASATQSSAEASGRAAEATERSVSASERAAAIAAQDARVRRIEAVLDTVIEMRDLFSAQYIVHEHDGQPWTPAYHSPEAIERLALKRRLDARLVPFDEEFDSSTNVRTLTYTENWGNTILEGAITEVKKLLKSEVLT